MVGVGRLPGLGIETWKPDLELFTRRCRPLHQVSRHEKPTSFLSALCPRTAPLSKSRANKGTSLLESTNVCPMKAGPDSYCPVALAELPDL